MAPKVTAAMVINRVNERSSRGQPVVYSRGPMADRRAKRALGMSGPPSQICAAIKEAVGMGRLEMIETGGVAVVFAGERERTYPVVQLRVITRP